MRIKGRVVEYSEEIALNGEVIKGEFTIVDDDHGGIEYIIEFDDHDNETMITVRDQEDEEKVAMSESTH